MEVQPATYWGWAVKGLGGAVRILAMLAESRLSITGHWVSELEGWYRQLGEVIERVKRSDYPSG